MRPSGVLSSTPTASSRYLVITKPLSRATCRKVNIWQLLSAATNICSGSTAPGAAHRLPTTWAEAVAGTTWSWKVTVWPRL